MEVTTDVLNVFDTSQVDFISAHLPTTIAMPGPGVDAEPMAFWEGVDLSHSRSEWVQAWVEMIDLDGNGYDDRGEHDAGPVDWAAPDVDLREPDAPPPLPPLPALPDPAEAEDFVDRFNAIMPLIKDIAPGDKSAVFKFLDDLLKKVSLPLEISTEVVSTIAVWEHPGSSDVDKNVALTMAIISSVVAAGSTLAVPVGAGLGLLYTFYLKDEIEEVVRAHWENEAASGLSAGFFAMSGEEMTSLGDQILDILSAGPVFDPVYYAAHHADAVEAVASGEASSVFAYFLTIGAARGDLPAAGGQAINPADLVFKLPNNDAAAGARDNLGWVTPGGYVGDGLDAGEKTLADALQATASGGLNPETDADLTVLANRIAIDLALHREWYAANGLTGATLVTTGEFSSGISIATLLPGLDLDQVRFFVVSGAVSSPEMALALLESAGAVSDMLADTRSLGVAEYGGVWVVAVSTEAVGQGATAADDFTFIRYGSLEADTLFAGMRAAELYGLDGDDRLYGGGQDDLIDGGDGADFLAGRGADDALSGAGGDDTLDGGGGADHMTGGFGDDTYVVDNAGDVIVEVTGQGTDTVRSSISFAFSGQSLENLILTGSANINATANTKDNTLVGNSGNNILDGKTGADHMSGGFGNDTYIVDNVGDVIVELTGQGTDTVRSSISFAFTGQSLENLTLTGAANINATANSKDNILIGNSGNNILDGKTGADKMTGGLGDDTYIVDNVGDVIVEVTGEGTDTVRSSISFAFTGQSLENLILTGSANINATANSKANTLVGNSGNNILDGKTGADHMTGGLGDDTYIVDNTGDVIVEVTGEGTDTVRSSISFAFTGQSLENLILTGSANINATANSKANTLVGNSGNNILDGKTGADHMTGGLGNDTYIVDNTGDVIVEVTGEGTDTVRSSISFAFSGQSLENLTLTGSANINATANSKANIVIGNSGNNIINGRGGADVLTGSGGNDTYVFSATSESTVAASDRITDLSNGDFIDLSQIDANTTAGGVQHFTLVNAFNNTAGQVTLSYNAGTNLTTLLADTNGDGVADMRVLINGDHDDFTNFIFGGG